VTNSVESIKGGIVRAETAGGLFYPLKIGTEDAIIKEVKPELGVDLLCEQKKNSSSKERLVLDRVFIQPTCKTKAKI